MAQFGNHPSSFNIGNSYLPTPLQDRSDNEPKVIALIALPRSIDRRPTMGSLYNNNMKNKKNSMIRNAFLALVLTYIYFVEFLQCEAFESTISNISGRKSVAYNKKPKHTVCYVLAEPPKDSLDLGASSFPPETATRRYRNDFRKKRLPYKKQYGKKKEDVWTSGRWNRAVQVESQLLTALEVLQNSIKWDGEPADEDDLVMLPQYPPLPFPAIRDCNAALAAFGDGGDLLRALRMYFKMRKAASLSERSPSHSLFRVPTPTLVTFSTMMSRANNLGKPLVAVRLWNIMRRQPDFFSSSSSSIETSHRIVPDVKAANILMNCYSKLGNLESAQDLLEQMLHGNGNDVPRMTPNLVTYNTLLDACHKSGELDAALHIMQQLQTAGMRPDARTYTTLIATVARKAGAASGANDPTLAFSFLQEMKDLNIRPNGMTYSALIDACGRCQRSDLALKGLRLMLDQKAQGQKRFNTDARGYTLSSEVGAWTAAINACGKANRIDAALKLFQTMPNFGVYPNQVTCGALMDNCLRNGRTADGLDVLRYMKKHRIAPSEVMYTSLMTSAVRLAEFENNQHLHLPHLGRQKTSRTAPNQEVSIPLDDSGATKAVEVYTELMTSLMQKPKRNLENRMDAVFSAKKLEIEGDDSKELFKVSLVFQEMEAVGVEPDLGCYNALLKSCANAGNVDRAVEVLNQIVDTEDLEPNDTTWREMIRAAGKAGRADIAISTWKKAIEDTFENERGKPSRSRRKQTLSAKTLGALLAALVRGAEDDKIDRHTKLRLYQLVVKIYEAVISRSFFLGMGNLDQTKILQNARVMAMFLQAVVSLKYVLNGEEDSEIMDSGQLRQFAISIVSLECFDDGLPLSIRRNSFYSKAYQISRSWCDAE